MNKIILFLSVVLLFSCGDVSEGAEKDCYYEAFHIFNGKVVRYCFENYHLSNGFVVGFLYDGKSVILGGTVKLKRT